MPTSHLSLLLSLLLIQALVSPGRSVQEIQTSHDIITKIHSAAEMMKCSAVLDVLFLLDGSYSVGKGSFERSKHYALKLSQALDIRPDKVRVGVIQFGSSPRLEISLDSCSTKGEFRKRLKKISYRGGSTQTGAALDYVLRKGFPGGRNASVSRALILLSDGKSQGAVGPAAARLKHTGVILFTVGLRYPRYAGCCQVEAFPCERKTLETLKEFQGNFMCWKGSRGYSPYTSLCPYYKWNKVYKRHQTVCHRTICPEPCDSQPCLNGGTCVSEGAEAFRCVCLPGYGGDPQCAPKLSLDCSVDLLFLLEGSTSLTPEGFLRLKSFLKRFLQAVMGNDTPTKVGLAVFGGETRVEAAVGRFKGDVRGLLRAVDALQPIGGEARTGQALRYVTRHGFQSAPVFADVTDDLPRVVVLLTATPAQDDVVEPSKYARDREIFLIGLGPEVLKGQLNNVTGNPQRTVTYASPDRFSAKIPELKAKICSVDSQGCLSQALDLVFVLDGSAGVGRDNFGAVRDFVRSVSVQFDVNRDVAQLGLVVYGRRPVTTFDLDAHDSGSAVLRAVEAAAYLGDGSASTGSALLHVRSAALTVTHGARPGVNKAVVVVTDGGGGDDAAVPAQKIRDDGVPVFVVGVGDVQRDRLLRIAGTEDHVIVVPSYDDLKYYEDVLVQMVCSEVKKPVDLCKPNPCMNDGTCVLSGGSFRCQCRGFEGPHCETRSTRPGSTRPGSIRGGSARAGSARGGSARGGSARASSRGDFPRPAALRKKSRQKKSHQELLHHYKQHRRTHTVQT